MHNKLTDKVREASSAAPNIPRLAKDPQALDLDVLVGLVQATGDGITVWTTIIDSSTPTRPHASCSGTRLTGCWARTAGRCSLSGSDRPT